MPNARSSRNKQDDVLDIATNNLPYLDLDFLWNTKLKYMNKGITYTNTTFNAIPSGIFNRLAKIPSILKKNSQMRIDEKYQGNAKALTKAGLEPNTFPTLK